MVRTLALRIVPLMLAMAVIGCGRAQTTPGPGPGRGTRPARMRSGPGGARRPGAARRPGLTSAGARAAGAFALTTSAFANNAPIPGQYTAKGQGISPPLRWTAPPAGTKAMALIVSDPDAPGRTYIHWVVYGIPAAARSLPGSVPKRDTLPQLGGIKQGKNSAGTIGWTPPSPPPGKVHHYHFRLYALDAPVNLTPGAIAADVEMAMKGHLLGTAEVTGTYRQ